VGKGVEVTFVLQDVIDRLFGRALHAAEGQTLVSLEKLQEVAVVAISTTVDGKEENALTTHLVMGSLTGSLGH
jgi:hypothetical protein